MTQTYSTSLSLIMDGKLRRSIEQGELQPEELLLPSFYVGYFEYLQSQGSVKGDIGMVELSSIQEWGERQGFSIVFFGDPSYDWRAPISTQVRQALSQRMKDASILVSSLEEARVFRLYQIPCQVLGDETELPHPLHPFFSEGVMSLHFKQGKPMVVKRGEPGHITFEEHGDAFGYEELERLIDRIVEFADQSQDGYIERDVGNVIIAQLTDVRVVIVRPPLSDGIEVTAVRPVRKLSLEEYELSSSLYDHLSTASGILIAGSPGSGKSTFCQAIAEYYADKEQVVKTIESPRDLQVDERITQLSFSHARREDITNILRRSRPDYTIYDEIRNLHDVEVYADLRLAGIGMVGVIHANKALDAIQRFVGKLELGIIPQVIDTVIFISKGSIEEVLQLKATVKVPAGMTESDLARPVIEVKRFTTQEQLYEMYTYGEQTMVVDLSLIDQQESETKVMRIARHHLDEEFQKMGLPAYTFTFESENRILLKVPEGMTSEIIGKGGKSIEALERKLGINITVEKLEKRVEDLEELAFSMSETKANYFFHIQKSTNYVEFYGAGELLFSLTVSKKGVVKVKKKSTNGKLIERIIRGKEELRLYG